MMSRGHAEGTWSPFRLPIKLLTTMMMMIVIVMMWPYAPAIAVMSNLLPPDSAAFGGPTTGNITCEYNKKNFKSLKLLQNNTPVVIMEYSKGVAGFRFTKREADFACSLPLSTSDSGVVNCWKLKFECMDTASYSCYIIYTSTPKFIKAKSSIKSLEYIGGKYEIGKVSKLKCVAKVVKPIPSSVSFKWTVESHKKQEVIDKKESVPDSKGCLAEVTSYFSYKILKNHLPKTTISCTIFDQTLSKVIDVQIKPPASTSSRVAASKWIFGLNLLLLLLVVAISR